MMQRNERLRPPLSCVHAIDRVLTRSSALPVNEVAPELRLVLDTNVWLDLLLFADPRYATLRQRLASGARVLMDAPCREEWLRVLGYPALRLEAARAQQLVDELDALSSGTEAGTRPPPWPPLPRCRDRDDQKFLALACAGHASHLLSRDTALLCLDGRTRRAGLFRICRPEDLHDAIG